MVSCSVTSRIAAPTKERSTAFYNWSFWVLLLLYESFLFSLPLLPNGDGPVHTYLSSVFWKIVMHRSPFYAHYYVVRHLLQPYSLHYYLLIFFERWFSINGAEKVVGGLIWATVAVGFRALVRALAPTAPAASLLVFPLLFSWPFSAGFFNYVFGCGFLLFSLAAYTHLTQERRSGTYFSIFVVTLVFQVLAHPVPLMVLICLVGFDLLLWLLACKQQNRPLRLPRAPTAAFVLSCLALTFPLLIADKGTVGNSLRDIYPHLHLFLPMLAGIYVSFFGTHTLIGWLYQALIVFVLPASLWLLLRNELYSRLRQGTTEMADRLILSSILLLGASLVLPTELNGSAYFSVRLWFPVWLLVASCVAAVPGRRTQSWIAGFGIAVGLLSLSLGWVYLRPVAQQQAELEHAPLPPGKRGLLIESGNALDGRLTDTWWALNFWSGVRAFTAHNDVLLNTPWMQLTILPLTENGHAGLMRDVTPNVYSENANFLPKLNKNPAQKKAALQLADFVLITDPAPHPHPLAMAVSLFGPFTNQWQCAQHDFYAVCERKGNRP